MHVTCVSFPLPRKIEQMGAQFGSAGSVTKNGPPRNGFLLNWTPEEDTERGCKLIYVWSGGASPSPEPSLTAPEVVRACEGLSGEPVT